MSEQARRDARGCAALTRAVSRGDPQSLAVFYETWFRVVFRYVRRLTGRDESFCLDAVQETFLRLMKRMRPLASEEDAARWVRSVARSAALDLLRRESRRLARERRAAGDRAGTEESADPIETEEQKAWLLAQIADLPTKDRTLLSARFADGTTLSEASRTQGASVHAAHGRVRRLIEALRAKAIERFGHE